MSIADNPEMLEFRINRVKRAPETEQHRAGTAVGTDADLLDTRLRIQAFGSWVKPPLRNPCTLPSTRNPRVFARLVRAR